MRFNTVFLSVSLVSATDKNTDSLHVPTNVTNVTTSGILSWKNIAATGAVAGAVALGVGSFYLRGGSNPIYPASRHEVARAANYGNLFEKPGSISDLAVRTKEVLFSAFGTSAIRLLNPWAFTVDLSLHGDLLDKLSGLGVDVNKLIASSVVVGRLSGTGSRTVDTFIGEFEGLLDRVYREVNADWRLYMPERVLPIFASEIHDLVVDAFEKRMITLEESEDFARALYDRLMYTAELGSFFGYYRSNLQAEYRSGLQYYHPKLGGFSHSEDLLTALRNGKCEPSSSECLEYIQPLIDCSMPVKTAGPLGEQFHNQLKALRISSRNIVVKFWLTREQIHELHEIVFGKFIQTWKDTLLGSSEKIDPYVVFAKPETK